MHLMNQKINITFRWYYENNNCVQDKIFSVKHSTRDKGLKR